MTYLPAGLPTPSPSESSKGFWDAAKKHRIAVPSCRDCGNVQWEPEIQCDACYGKRFSWKDIPAIGSIFSWTRIWHPVHPSLRQAGPYLVVVVQLADEPKVRLVGNLLGNPHQAVEIGLAVHAVFEDRPDQDVTLVQWELD